MEAEASAASAAWVGADGRAAPFFRLAADARFARLGYVALLGCRFVQTDAPGGEADAASVIWSGSVEAGGWFGQARAAVSLRTGTGAPETGEPAAVEVDTRWRPEFAPWLALASSWKVSGGESERFDLSAQALFGKRTRFAIDSGLRFAPEGRFVKGAFSIARTLGAIGLSCAVRNSDWIGPGADWPRSLAVSLKATLSLK